MVRPTLPLTPPRGGAHWPRARGADPTGTAARRRHAHIISAPCGPGRRRWWLAVAVIAGLMAMHGFGTHGSHSAITSSEAHHSANAMVGHSPSSVGSTLSTTLHVADTNASIAGGALLEAVASPLTSDSGRSSLLGLCLALLTLGLTLLLARTGSRVAWTVPRMTTALRRNPLPATAHTLDPPSRAELCIWRC